MAGRAVVFSLRYLYYNIIYYTGVCVITVNPRLLLRICGTYGIRTNMAKRLQTVKVMSCNGFHSSSNFHTNLVD